MAPSTRSIPMEATWKHSNGITRAGSPWCRPSSSTARADLDALVAAGLGRTAVRADFFAVVEEARLFELADQARGLARGERLLERIVARRQVALRQLVQPQDRLARKVEHQIELLAAQGLSPREIDRTDRCAGSDAFAMRLALVEIDLVVIADRAFRTGAHAGVAARADLEIDRIFLPPLDLEGAQPAGKLAHASGPDRIFALERQLAAFAGDQHAHRQPRREPFRPLERRLRGTDDQELAAGFEFHRRRGLRLGQRRHRHQPRDLRQRAFARPARLLAHVDELEVRARPGLLRQLTKQRGLLRAGDDHIGIAERALERRRILAAQLVVHHERRARLQGARERLGVDAYRAITAADLKCLAFQAHLASLPPRPFVQLPARRRLFSLPR